MITGSISFTITVSPTQLEDLRALERSMAFDHAAGLISSECDAVAEGEEEDAWFDLDSADGDLSAEAKYLESRSLLKRNPEHPQWVMIADSEDQPFEVTP